MKKADNLNPWLSRVVSRANKIVEDSDRKNFASVAFVEMIRRVERIATSSATRTPEPKISREQDTEGVTLVMSWDDPPSGWYLHFLLRRKLGEKPRVVLDFYSADKQYSQNKPSDQDIIKAIHDYFEAWRRQSPRLET